MRTTHIYAAGAVTAVLVLATALIVEQQRLDTVLEQQTMQMQTNSARFEQAIRQIDEEKKKGTITEKEASGLRLQAYKALLSDNQEILETSVEAIVNDPDASATTGSVRDQP